MECLTEEEERKKEYRRTKKDIDSPQSFEANKYVEFSSFQRYVFSEPSILKRGFKNTML